MEDHLFPALLVDQEAGGTFSRRIAEKKISDLPDHDVLIRVEFSSLNYKDALSSTGNRGVTKKYPHKTLTMQRLWPILVLEIEFDSVLGLLSEIGADFVYIGRLWINDTMRANGM